MEIMSLLGQVTALTLLILLCSIMILLCALPHQPVLLLVACASLPASMAMATSSVPRASPVVEGDLCCCKPPVHSLHCPSPPSVSLSVPVPRSLPIAPTTQRLLKCLNHLALLTLCSFMCVWCSRSTVLCARQDKAAAVWDQMMSKSLCKQMGALISLWRKR